MRVANFVYDPFKSKGNCVFKVPTKRGAETYHQCTRYARETIEGYGFCVRHAALVNAALNKPANKRDNNATPRFFAA